MRAAWWWIDRWRTSSAYMALSLAEQGAYRNLIDELWLRDGVLPDNDRVLSMASGAGAEWPTVKEAVMRYFVKTPEGWRNLTHDKVAADSKAHRDSQAAKGRARASAATRVGGRFVAGGASPAEHQPGLQPPSLDLDLSLDQTQTQKIPSESPSSPAVTPTPKRKTDPLVLDLKNRLGSSTTPCAAQIRALRGAGWDDARIAQAISDFAEPGMAPWDWTKKARGVVPTNGHFKTMADRSDEIVRSILGGGS